MANGKVGKEIYDKFQSVIEKTIVAQYNANNVIINNVN